MFIMDPLDELNFVLEFDLPKEISDNQDHIKLSVHRIEVPKVEIPLCPIGYKPRPIRTPGEIHCLEYYKYIKDVLPFINKWVNSIYCTCSKLNSSRNNQFVEAKLYAYRQDHSLFKTYDLVDFHPLFNPNIEFFSDDTVELIFKFENIAEVDDKPMYDISKYIKEYKDRNNKCEFCAYYNIQGGRCYTCKNHNWFVQEIDLKQYVIKRVSEDSAKEFINSKEGCDLKAKAVLDKATELVKKSFKYREMFNESHPEYQINNWDCGWYQIKALLKEFMPDDLKEFRNIYKQLADKMRPMVYELGFLKK